MPRTREVPRDEAHPFAQQLYEQLFGDRDPTVEPGTSTGTPGNWWSVTAAVPDMFDHIVAGFSGRGGAGMHHDGCILLCLLEHNSVHLTTEH